MFNFLKIERFVYLQLLVSIIIGVYTGFIGVALFFLLLIVLKANRYKLELLFFAFLLTYILANNFSGVLSYNENLRFALLGISLMYLHRYNVKGLNLGVYTLPFVALSLGVTVLFSFLGIEAVLKCLAYFFVAFAIFKFINILYWRKANFSTLIFKFFFVFILANLLLVIVPSFYLEGRFKGLLGNPNGLGMLLVFIYGIIDLLKQRKELYSLERLINIAYIAIWVLILLTRSRTAFVALVIYFIFEKFYHKKKLRVPVFIICSALLLAFFTINLEVFVTSIGLEDYIRLNTLESASGRTEVWDVAWNEIKNNLWFGQGFTFDNYFINDYADRFVAVKQRHWSGIWSSYLSLLLNVGLIGVLLYMIMVFKFYRKATLKPVALRFVVMALLIGVTESWMAASMNPFTPLFFLYFAIQSQPLKKTLIYQ